MVLHSEISLGHFFASQVPRLALQHNASFPDAVNAI
jgi:hypothetical protein